MLPKNAYRSVQEVAENIRICSIRINKIVARHHCTQISAISILIPGATPLQNGLVNSPPHRETGGGLGKMGPQRDHRTESDFPASFTQRTIEMQHEQICSEASRAATTETPLPLGASDYVANAQTKSNDSDSSVIDRFERLIGALAAFDFTA
jgi:hypothetical protein